MRVNFLLTCFFFLFRDRVLCQGDANNQKAEVVVPLLYWCGLLKSRSTSAIVFNREQLSIIVHHCEHGYSRLGLRHEYISQWGSYRI
ncbi:hypothetical protein BDV25DRAFT_162295 [Aspergillus avenaceus]|uniref:Secreted protein n=1 Tax=Aspergillus avenaceus TaxID=36643 RepID=A0A5N6TJS2_ASPAV|nr:hypothetical protein BDV25DRAFT_162295 [Aspergillus avenaceus]